jgi:hypothetical protein
MPTSSDKGNPSMLGERASARAKPSASAPSPVIAETEPPTTTPLGLPRLAWEWFSRSSALRTTRAALSASGNVELLCRRARIAAEVGERTLEPSWPWTSGAADHLAAALFVESIGWSLRAMSEARAPQAGAEQGQPAQRTELAALVETCRGSVEEAARGSEAVDGILEDLLERRFELVSATPAETEQRARALGSVARRLLQQLPNPQVQEERLIAQRLTRLGGLVVLGVLVAIGVSRWLGRVGAGVDLAANKPWTTSSSGDVACTSPAQRCDAVKGYFFHTQEEKQPWLQLDLQRSGTISRLRISNRQDCCQERAVPLIVEVSRDGEEWREAARRKEAFDVWTPEFDPIAARYVRLRVGKRSILHLSEVQVFR